MVLDTYSCQPLMTKKRDKILKKVGFSAKKRKYWIKRAKITQLFGVKKPKFATFGRHEKVGQSQKSGTVGNLAPKKGTVPPK